jgi:hypothetical protein
MDVYIIEPRLDEIFIEQQNGIDAWSGKGEQVAIWNTRRLYKATRILQSMNQTTKKN